MTICEESRMQRSQRACVLLYMYIACLVLVLNYLMGGKCCVV